MTNRSMGWNAVLCMQLATYASQFVLNGMPGLLQPLQCWAYTGRSLSLGGYFADAASCPEYLARVRSPDIVLLLTSALNLTCGDSLMASVNGGANPTQLATRLCITPGGSPPQPAPAPSPSSPDITLPCTASITVTSAVDRPWGLAQCDLLALFANQLYVDWLGPLIYNSSSGVLLPFACYSQNSQSLSVQALFTLDTCYSAQLVFVLYTPARLIASALNLTCGDSITGVTSYNTTASKTWADDLLCNAPVNKVINYGIMFDASTCDHLASFASIVVMIVSAVLSGSQANTSFFQALSNAAAAQLLAISFDLACGDSVSAYSATCGGFLTVQRELCIASPAPSPPLRPALPPPPSPLPSSRVCTIVTQIYQSTLRADPDGVPVQYTQGHCDHLAFYSNIMYLADIPRNTLTGPRLLSNFTCFFFSTNTLIVVASVREAAASSTFFGAFNNTMAAELAGVAFNLGCGDQLHASSSCNGDVMPFPFSNCNRASDRSPWRMSLASQEAGFYNPASRVAGTRVCLVVFVNRTAAGSCRVDGGNTCCTMGMNKVDFNVAPDCQHSVQDVTVNGEPASPAIFERTTPVMKITGLKTPYATGLIDGVEVCFTLDETSNCPTLSSLCGGTVCRYAVYNEPQRYNCCP
ncbi:DUF3707 domain-containing protein, partial [Haematococcus lacustris]